MTGLTPFSPVTPDHGLGYMGTKSTAKVMLADVPTRYGKEKLELRVAPDVSVGSTAVLSAKPLKLALTLYFPAAAVSALNTSVASRAM